MNPYDQSGQFGGGPGAAGGFFGAGQHTGMHTGFGPAPGQPVGSEPDAAAAAASRAGQQSAWLQQPGGGFGQPRACGEAGLQNSRGASKRKQAPMDDDEYQAAAQEYRQFKVPPAASALFVNNLQERER